MAGDKAKGKVGTISVCLMCACIGNPQRSFTVRIMVFSDSLFSFINLTPWKQHQKSSPSELPLRGGSRLEGLRAQALRSGGLGSYPTTHQLLHGSLLPSACWVQKQYLPLRGCFRV